MHALKLSELIGALSYALDLTEGQPAGHCVRCCWIGSHLGRQLGLSEPQQWELYYTLLLKDLGCSSNAARICQLYATDDLNFKRDYKWVDGSLPKAIRFVLRHTGERSGLVERLGTFWDVLSNSEDFAKELIHTRCTRGADIARQLRFPDAVAAGIHSLDEHWDGGGLPEGLSGQAIPLYARIALLAQVVDVFQFGESPQAALEEVQKRSGSWFDPELCAAFAALGQEDAFWAGLRAPDLEQQVLAMEPASHERTVDEDYLDDITEAFGQVVDAKSPYTAGHSARVGLYTVLIAESLGLPEGQRRWLRRGALLHDVGKLGVSNAILDKPGKLDAEEWAAVQRHASYTGTILGRIRVFQELSGIAAAHHERPDGTGYPLKLQGEQISLDTRIITTADIFDAITAKRPYRDAVPIEKTLSIMWQEVDKAIDRSCLEHLTALTREHPELFTECRTH